MNKETNLITNRLSLRTPQRESLEILATILDQINLGEDNGLSAIVCDNPRLWINGILS